MREIWSSLHLAKQSHVVSIKVTKLKNLFFTATQRFTFKKEQRIADIGLLESIEYTTNITKVQHIRIIEYNCLKLLR